MKLVFITQDFLPEIGGIETYSSELSSRIYNKFDFFTLICPFKKKARDEELDFPVKRIKTSNTLLFTKIGTALSELTKKVGPLDASFHTQWQTIPHALKAKEKGRLKRVFVAAHTRELLYNPFGSGILASWYFNRMKRLLTKADHFFPVSDYTKSLLVDLGIPEERITVIKNGVDPTQFYPIPKNEIPGEYIFSDVVLLSVTRLVERKGIDLVLKAFLKVVKEFPSAMYLIAGEGREKNRLVKLAESLGISSNVKFLGKVDYKELNRLYNACTMFVLPSRTIPPDVEGFGIAFLEANACSKPVIGTNSGGIPSAIIEGETGFMIQEENEKQLVEKILYLFRNPDYANEMGIKGRKRVVEKLNWNTISETLVDIIQRELK